MVRQPQCSLFDFAMPQFDFIYTGAALSVASPTTTQAGGSRVRLAGRAAAASSSLSFLLLATWLWQ
jgi:hypothetical protein